MVVSKSVERVYSPTKNDQLVKRLDSTVSWKSLENAYFITQLLSSSDHIFDPNYCKMLNTQYSTMKQTMYAQQLSLDWHCNLSIRLSPLVPVVTSIDNPRELYYAIWMDEQNGESDYTKININKIAVQLFDRMKEWSELDKNGQNEDFIYLAACIHRIYPHLNRSIRSRVEEYRGFVNQYILHVAQHMERSSKPTSQDLLFLHILSIASSFPPIGIQSSPNTEIRRTLLQYVIHLHSQLSHSTSFSSEMEYLISRCVYGLHRQLQDQDILVLPKQLPTTPISTSSSTIHHSGENQNVNEVEWQICVVDSLGKAITHLDVMCRMNQTVLPLRLEGECYHLELSPLIREEVGKMDYPLHVVVSKRYTTVLYETDLSIVKSSSKSTLSWGVVGMTTVVGLMLLLILYYRKTDVYHPE